MVPPPGRLGRGVKLPIQVRLCPEESATVDTFAAELRPQSDGASFRREHQKPGEAYPSGVE